MKPEGESIFKPLKSGIYVATYLSYTLRQHEADPKGRYDYEKEGYLDFDTKWELMVPGEGKRDRHYYPRITATCDEKSNLVQMWVALDVAKLEDLRKNGVGDVYALMDRCVGRSCIWVMESTVRQDGKAGDKIKAMSPATGPLQFGGDPAGGPARAADPRFDDDDSEIPF